MAHQYLKQTNPQLLDCILANTRIKISGETSESDLSKFCSYAGIDKSQIDEVKGVGRFICRVGRFKPFIFKTPHLELGKKRNEQAINKVLTDQKHQYYKKHEKIIIEEKNDFEFKKEGENVTDDFIKKHNINNDEFKPPYS